MSTQLTDHEAQIQEDLAGPYIDDEAVRAILAIYGAKLQEIEDCIFAVFAAHDLALDPTGNALETLLKLLQVHNPGGGIAESRMRTLLKMRAVGNRSHGYWEEALELIDVEEMFLATKGYQLPGGVLWIYAPRSLGASSALGLNAPTLYTRTVADELHRAAPAGAAAVYFGPDMFDLGGLSTVEWGYDHGTTEESGKYFSYAIQSGNVALPGYLYQVGVESP